IPPLPSKAVISTEPSCCPIWMATNRHDYKGRMKGRNNNLCRSLRQSLLQGIKSSPKLMALIIKQRNVSDIVVLDLGGRLWVLDLPLRDLVNGILVGGRQNFVLNLAGVDYIDSSGLGQLISIWTSIRSRGGDMTILNPTKRVQQL